jgi:hypothetical protein
MRTEKTIRAKGQWVKITRRVDKSFVIARGHEGECQAHEVKEYPARLMPTWGDAVAHAEVQMETYR